MATEQIYIPMEAEADLPLIVQNDEARSGAKTSARALYRHPSDKRLGGICGGLGEYFDIDPVLIRILWILATLATGGIAIFAYGVSWLILPVGTAEGGEREPAPLALGENGLVRVAWVLIGLGILWLLANTGILPTLWSGFWGMMGVLFWPALLIVVGILILRSRNETSLGEDVKSKMPDSEAVKAGIKNTRQRIPLKRPANDRMLLGVCAGLARTFNVDVAIVRLLWALFSIGSIGVGVIIYVLLAIVLPEDDPETAIEAVEGEILDPVM